MKKIVILIFLFQVHSVLSQEALFVSAKNGLIVRSEPNKKSKRIGKLKYAEKIVTYQNTGRFDTIIDDNNNVKGEWYHIITNDIEGYVFNAFLTPKKLSKKFNYYEFSPKSIPDFKLPDFDVDHANTLDSLKVITGNYRSKNEPDSQKDWGDRLLLLNTTNKILFQSIGVGDVYLFEPHFYKNNSTGTIIIICQLGYEYCFGGEVFIFENESISAIGTLDIESKQEEKCLTDIIEIQEVANEILFSFNSEYLILEPGTNDIVIKNKGVTYTYANRKLILTR